MSESVDMQYEKEIKQPEALDTIGELFRTIYTELGRGADAPPIILSASAAKFLMGVDDEQEIGDIDVFTTDSGLHILEALLNKHKDDMRAKNLEISLPTGYPNLLARDQRPRLTGTLEVASGKPYLIDVWPALTKTGVLEGVEDVNVTKDVNFIEISYLHDGVSVTVPVPVFSPDALVKIYQVIQQRQNEFKDKGILNEVKPRNTSIKESWEAKTLELN